MLCPMLHVVQTVARGVACDGTLVGPLLRPSAARPIPLRRATSAAGESATAKSPAETVPLEILA